jgi:uncharacterized protein (DUF305 family)
MKTIILTVLLSASAIAFAACQTAPTINTNTAAQNSNKNSMMNMNGMNHNGMMNGNSMNHNGMTMSGNSNMSGMMDMKSSPNAASAPYDLQFLDTMTHHHQMAVDMAKTAVGKTQNQELKAFAQKIIADQNKEIAQMKDWREKWFAGKPPAMNMEMDGMEDSMKGMDMKKLESSSGKEFDLEFINQMTPHHDGAVEMGREALTKAEKPEIKTLANQIIKAQEAEIKQMADWKAKWSK